MINNAFEFKQINETLDELVSNQSLNFAKVLFADPEVKISVTASFAPTLMGEQYCVLDRELNTVMSSNLDSFYYGASPLLNSKKIREAVSQMKLSSAEKIDEFISENASLFMLHESQKEYLLAFARYLVIAFSSNYGIRLQFPSEIDIESEIKPYLVSGQCTVNDNKVCLHGCPSVDLLARLNKFRFTKSEIEGINRNERATVWKLDENTGESIEKIYSLPASVILLDGTVLYSGVLLKPLMIEKEPSEFENDGIVSVVIYFERSTYAAVFSMDNVFINHPLLDKASREKLIRFFIEDDNQKRLLAQNTVEVDNDSIFDVVTEYLMKCHNVNQIGISETVVTKDGIAVFSQRNARAIDSSFIYPGVNGNAELYDRDVSFYRESVYEDTPTIRLSDDRLDFQGEICREAYAELGLTLEKQMCACRGIVLSGSIPPDSESPDYEHDKTRRRMQLNIIFEQQCDKTFDELLSSCKSASESFENETLLGLRLKCYDNYSCYIRQNVHSIFKVIISSKDILESLLLLIVFCFAMTGRNIEATISVNTVLSFVLAILILVVNIGEGFAFIRKIRNRKKRIRNAAVFKRMEPDKMSDVAKHFLACYQYHPVTAAALKLYIDSTVYNAFWR